MAVGVVGVSETVKNLVDVVTLQGDARQSHIQFRQVLFSENDSRDFVRDFVEGLGYLFCIAGCRDDLRDKVFCFCEVLAE